MPLKVGIGYQVTATVLQLCCNYTVTATSIATSTATATVAEYFYGMLPPIYIYLTVSVSKTV